MKSWSNIKKLQPKSTKCFLLAATGCLILSAQLHAESDYVRALKRSQYLLHGTIPTDSDIDQYGRTESAYRTRIRELIEHPNFYNAVLRYHEQIFGTGLPGEYIEELRNNEIDDHQNKFARITCVRTEDENPRLRCRWASTVEDGGGSECPVAEEESVSVFWYPGVIAWACPALVRACGYDLSRCFIQHPDPDTAKNSELGTTEIFDSRFSVIKSLSKQASGIATRIVTENYPYHLILKSGLTAVDGAIAHLYKQNHHFKVDQLRIPNEVIDIVEKTGFTDSRYTLVNTGESYESGGIISTFGWLRRYEKHRTRGNELYERLLCRKFVSELPRVFPQDPGNLRTTPGCSGCHATLDPLADFFSVWGEGGALYDGEGATVHTSFAGKSGSNVSDLAGIVAADKAFATCTTMNVWEWLVGRKFYFSEDQLRTELANYLIETRYSFRELVYAIATHPAYTARLRGDGTVTDPLEEPPLGELPENTTRECTETYTYTDHIAPKISMCTNCHSAGSEDRVDLTTESQWQAWGSQAVQLMASGQMPPGQFGPEVIDFKETVRCWLEQ